jgi:thiosulfate reductase cytochrome b subunit
MAVEGIASSSGAPLSEGSGHRAWVRACHWIVAISFLFLCVSGVYIFAVYPRLHWGEVGNSLTPAILEIPITANHRPEGWERTATFPVGDGEIFTASRIYERELFNQNGWARSLHFLAAWFLFVTGLVYLVTALASGHARRNIVPGASDLAPARLWQDLRSHMSFEQARSGGGPPYGLLQRVSYFVVIFLFFPLMVLTGMTMSPAMTAAFPVLLDVFGGYQSARTIHFFTFAMLLTFFIIHLVMVLLTGPARQLRGMILGR